MKSFLAQSLIPALKSVRGRSYSKRLEFLSKSQWWPPEDIREFQWRELKALLKVAFDSVPFYKQKYAGVHCEDIRTWEDFGRLPILTRNEVQQHLPDLRSTRYVGKTWMHSTGGSSGEPVRFYLPLESYDWRTAATARVYSWSGLDYSKRSLHLWGAPVGRTTSAGKIKTNIYNWVRNQKIMSTFVQSECVWRNIYAYVRERRPDILLGYVSSLVSFARFVEMFSLPLPPVVSIVAAAETLSERQREYLESVIGAPVFNTYGSREFMSIGGECEKREGLHLNAENLVVETSGDKIGGASPILVSDLHNHATIFLRYAIGDLGTLSSRRCSCGRGLPLLEKVVGRQNEVLRFADGREVSPMFFRHILKEIPEILEYQVLQVASSRIVLKVVARSRLSEAGRTLIEDEFKKVLGGAQFSIEVVKDIEKSRSGKSAVIVSAIGAASHMDQNQC